MLKTAKRKGEGQKDERREIGVGGEGGGGRR
jgi:hypothetical protein